MHKLVKKNFVPPLWRWLRENFTRIYTWFIIRLRFLSFLLLLNNINRSIRKKKREKNSPLRGFSLSRYVVTRYAVTHFTDNP